MSGRVIVIGDVHGCIRELEALLARLRPTAGDAVIYLGDVINRGPESHASLRLAAETGHVLLLGNHERRLLDYHDSGDTTGIRDYEVPTLAQLTEADRAIIRRMPLTHEEPSHGLVCVHGGFLPGQDWRSQPAEIVTEVQAVDTADHSIHRRNKRPDLPLWHDLWQGPPFVVYGHIPREEAVFTSWTAGIDTGCVYGGHLSALIFPGRELVQVRAARNYTQ